MHLQGVFFEGLFIPFLGRRWPLNIDQVGLIIKQLQGRQRPHGDIRLQATGGAQLDGAAINVWLGHATGFQSVSAGDWRPEREIFTERVIVSFAWIALPTLLTKP
ncbi:hypothetical protein D3C75_1075570 [compost metagenome]